MAKEGVNHTKNTLTLYLFDFFSLLHTSTPNAKLKKKETEKGQLGADQE